MPTENKPAEVSQTTTQAGDIRARWEWVEPSVWTDRMLTALEQGVKGGVWFSLIDKVWSASNLWSAWEHQKANHGAAGVDRQSVEDFERKLTRNLQDLADQLRTGRYEPLPVRRTWIPKAGKKELRPLGIPTLRDRIAQGAIRHVIEPIFEREFAEHSYGFRPGRGCKDALRRIEDLLKDGYRYVLDADLKGYFDTIPHEPLMARVRERIADGRILTLLEGYLKQDVMEDLKQWTPETGTPQGAVISPLLANLYLNPLDHLMAERGYEMVRYADDFVVLCRTPEDAQRAKAEVQAWRDANGLTLHPDKTRIVDVQDEGFDFLGYHFVRDIRWPRKKSLQKLKDAIRAKTRRNNGRCLPAIITDVNRTLRGWFEYFKHSHYTTWDRLDSWTRGRLRSILRRRQHRRGRARGADHKRWPNRFFAAAGLFCLRTAHRLACQSAQR